MNKHISFLENLNESQLKAVLFVNGPLLILAGAGTGKTTVLTSRILNLIKNNHAFPHEILSVTFTNKAAQEMRERIAKNLNNSTFDINMGTFHSVAAKILRKHATKIGYTGNYVIINQDDQLRIIKKILKDLNIDEKSLPSKIVLNEINRLKDRALPHNSLKGDEFQIKEPRLKHIYSLYQEILEKSNAMDFGDLILKNIELFNTNLDVCSYYQNKFKYILVDEYQDTNVAQYLWIRLLSQNNHNICCVGDDDQSIYGWRGAEIQNILRFDKDYPNTTTIRLEKNYRSTSSILNVASAIIDKNNTRHKKRLWTDKESGQKVQITNYYDDKEEARAIVDKIDLMNRVEKRALSDIAILVRAGHQTRNFEESLNYMNIPYKIVGSIKFYDRAEIRDSIAYIRLLNNKDDNLAFERIINVPKRGVGNVGLQNIIKLAKEKATSYFFAAEEAVSQKLIKGKAAKEIEAFTSNIRQFAEQLKTEEHSQIFEKTLDAMGYFSYLQEDKNEVVRDRIQNVKELIKSLSEHESISTFLEYISLLTDTSNSNDDEQVSIMTIHSAKGLEFHTVFLPGWEEGILPSTQAIDDKREFSIEEERRLAYVAVTRAKERLMISYGSYRKVYGNFQMSEPSRFINDIPKNEYKTVNNYFNQTYQDIRKKENFSVGTKVSHQEFGYGIILSIHHEFAEVFFEKGGVKTLLMEYLQLIK